MHAAVRPGRAASAGLAVDPPLAADGRRTARPVPSPRRAARSRRRRRQRRRRARERARSARSARSRERLQHPEGLAAARRRAALAGARAPGAGGDPGAARRHRPASSSPTNRSMRRWRTSPRRNNVPFAQLPEKLASQGYRLRRLPRQLRREIQRQMLRSRDVVQRINISPRELDQYLEQQKKTASAANRIQRLAHPDRGGAGCGAGRTSPRASKRARTSPRARSKGEAFSQLAVTFSDSQTALEGGALGWRKGPELPTFLADVVAALKAGEVSEVLQTATGFHIVRLNDSALGTAAPQIIKQAHLRHILHQDQRSAGRRHGEAEARPRCASGSSAARTSRVLAKASSEDPGSAVEGGDLGWTSSTPSSANSPRGRRAQGQRNQRTVPDRSSAGTSCRCSVAASFDNTANGRARAGLRCSCARAGSMRPPSSGCSSCATRPTSKCGI